MESFGGRVRPVGEKGLGMRHLSGIITANFLKGKILWTSVELFCAFNAIRFWFLNLDTYTLIEKNIHNFVKDQIMYMKGFSHI